MRKIILLAHISLDGFVAREKGELDGFEPGAENLEFVCDLTENADAALFGRKSYQLLEQYWPTAIDRPGATKGEIAYSDWYNRATKIVISKTLMEGSSSNTIIISNNIPEQISKIKQGSGKNILIFGSPMLSQLLMLHNLIGRYVIFINPVIFGKGIPLFVDMNHKMKLKLISTTEFPNGEIAHQFDVAL
jgi:dihydrofolate reductase